MMHKRLSFSLVLRYVLFAFFLLAAALIAALVFINELGRERTHAELSALARLVKIRLEKVKDSDADGAAAGIGMIIRETTQAYGFGLTYLDQSTRLIAENEDDLAALEFLWQDKEIKNALNSGQGDDIRYNKARKNSILYYALRLDSPDGKPAVIRLSAPLTAPPSAFVFVILFLSLGGAFVALGTALFIPYAVKINKPLQQLRKGMQDLARGNYTRIYAGKTFSEITDLITAANRTASLFMEQITAWQRRVELEDALVGSMLEGVIAVDLENRVLLMNNAACRLFHLCGANFEGRRIEQVVTQQNVLKLIPLALEAGQPVEDTFIIYERDEYHIHALGIVLKDAADAVHGVLIVLHDVTRMRRLENIRKEFAMNVSHELKTPLTSIKGYIETLRETSAMKDADRDKFLTIIAKQTDRVIAIVEDLLALARLEKESERGAIMLEKTRMLFVLNNAVEACAERAEKKRVTLTLSCPDDLEADLNAHLFEQAVINLVDNAVKYSNQDSQVILSTHKSADEILVSVRDFGIGIDKEHFPRLFERFYRVDKARSSELGGTGLGLAIVKHIAAAHRGRVDLESQEGKGSTFYIHLPLPQ